MLATQGISLLPYCCSGRLYGVRTPTSALAPSSSEAQASLSGASDLKLGTIKLPFSIRSGHTRTPASHDDRRTSPVDRAVSPQACFDKFADVSIAQSIVRLLLYRT